jgi:hypothetical protein
MIHFRHLSLSHRPRTFKYKAVYRVALLEERLVKQETDVTVLRSAAILQLQLDVTLLKERMYSVQSLQHNVCVTVERCTTRGWNSVIISDFRRYCWMSEGSRFRFCGAAPVAGLICATFTATATDTQTL